MFKVLNYKHEPFGKVFSFYLEAFMKKEQSIHTTFKLRKLASFKKNRMFIKKQQHCAYEFLRILLEADKDKHITKLFNFTVS